jgi:hypothetical protein
MPVEIFPNLELSGLESTDLKLFKCPHAPWWLI